MPESQVSPLTEKNCKPLKDKSNSLQHQYLPVENNLNKKVDKVDFPTVQSKVSKFIILVYKGRSHILHHMVTFINTSFKLVFFFLFQDRSG